MKRLVLAVALLASVALYAQQPGFTRKMLQDHDLSVSDRHAVQALAEFVPGGAAGKHTHPGEELGYVLEGTLPMFLPSCTTPAGTKNASPAFTVRGGKNIGSGAAKVLATYVVEKGKPVASPAK